MYCKYFQEIAERISNTWLGGLAHSICWVGRTPLTLHLPLPFPPRMAGHLHAPCGEAPCGGGQRLLHPPRGAGPWLLLQLTSEQTRSRGPPAQNEFWEGSSCSFTLCKSPAAPAARGFLQRSKPGHPVTPKTGQQPPLGGVSHSSPLHLGHLSLPKQTEVQRWG